ncbi:MAG TPA: transporter, partial [Verrucomicrobiales bacterium]|nr:transporter [Verrucomicrobiales bacterium]
DSILGNAALRQADNLLLPPLVGFGTVALGTWISFAVRWWTGLKTGPERRTFAFLTGTYNYGYVPIPLALSLFDRETAGVLIVHNLGVDIALWTIGLTMLGGIKLRDSWRHLLTPPLITILIGVSLNLGGAAPHVPGFVMTTFKALGACAIPMGIVLIGATVADLLPEFHPGKGGRVMALSCALRLGILPVLFLLLAKWGPFSIELQRVILLQAAMPAAVFPIIMAKHYGGDTSTALRVAIATSLVGMVTIPFWIRAGMKFLGL